MKRNATSTVPSRLFSLNRLFTAIAANLLAISASHAAPTGGNIVGGSGDITHTGDQTQINQESDRLAIDWDTFDVGRDEQVRFVQPRHRGHGSEPHSRPRRQPHRWPD